MKHKHHECIMEWLAGKEVEYYYLAKVVPPGWFPITKLSDFDQFDQVRIKPEPEPKEYYDEDTFDVQYLYIYNDSKNKIIRVRPTLLIEPLDWVYMGKVRLEK